MTTLSVTTHPAPWQKYALLGSLYITQYLGLSFFLTAVNAILRLQGVSPEQLNAIYLLGLFSILKILWAPLVDRINFRRLGHYRGWLLIMQSLLVVTLLLIGLFDFRRDLDIILALCVLAGLLAATQDIAADALSCRLLAPEERGLGNGIQVGGSLLGIVIGGGLVLRLYSSIGWFGSALLLAGVTAIPLVQLLFFHEPTDLTQRHVNPAARARFRDLLTFFGQPGMWRWLVLLIVYPLGVCTAYGLLTPLLVDAGRSRRQIDFSTNVVAPLLGFFSALVVGWLIYRFGRKPVMFAMALAMGSGLLLLLAPAFGSTTDLSINAGIGALSLLYSPALVVLSTVMMDNARPTSAGTDFTLQYCIFSLVQRTASGVGLTLANEFGYAAVIIGSSAAAFIATLIVALLYAPTTATKPVAPLGPGSSAG